MRILWVGKGESGTIGAGEEVYDRKLLHRLEQQYEIVRFRPKNVGPAVKFANLGRGIPLYRATYRSKDNIAKLQALVEEHLPDVVVISWEPYDFLAAAITCPTVLVLHNITSDAVTEVFHGHVLAKIYSSWTRRWERRLYRRDNIRAIVTLSERDAALTRELVGDKVVEVIPPGVPAMAAPPAAELRAEMLISGTYDWYPKRRDLGLIAKAISASAKLSVTPCWDHPLPAKLTGFLHGHMLNAALWAPALRFGLVPDTFSSGFKLKVGYYIANNCIVLSRSNVESDYADLPYHEMFVHRIKDIDDIHRIHEDLTNRNIETLAFQFETFKRACAERFDWDQSSARLASLLNRIVSKKTSALPDRQEVKRDDHPDRQSLRSAYSSIP